MNRIMVNPTFTDWQKPFCPFDAIGFARPTPLPPSQADFAKAVRIARFVTNSTRVSKAGDAAKNSPYTSDHVNQAVRYFTQRPGDDSNIIGEQAGDETLDTVAWEWAYQELVVFQYKQRYTRKWVPEGLRWEHVILKEPILVDLNPDASLRVGDRSIDVRDGMDDDGINNEHVESDGSIIADDMCVIGESPQCQQDSSVIDAMFDETIHSTTGMAFQPVTPAHRSLRLHQSILNDEARPQVTLANGPSPVLGSDFRRTRSLPPSQYNAKQDSDADDILYDNDDARNIREPSVPSPVKGDIPQAQSPQIDHHHPLGTKKRNHDRIHQTGVVLGFHRRQIRKLPAHLKPSQSSKSSGRGGNPQVKDYRQVVHGVVDALGRVQRRLRSTNIAGELVPSEHRLAGISSVRNDNIVFLAQFKGMNVEEINDEVLRLTA